MTFFGATVLSAVANAALAVLAAFTAIYAVKAFRKQSVEVKAIEKQVADQEKLTRQQEQRERQDQASRVFVWVETRAIEPAGAATGSPEHSYLMDVHVKNTSEQPVYDVVIKWRHGTSEHKGVDAATLMPGKELVSSRGLPSDWSPSDDLGHLNVATVCRDRNQVWWWIRSNGRFERTDAGAVERFN